MNRSLTILRYIVFISAVNVLPYQIGLAGVGFFAVCVLVFDMILCGKDKGVLYKVKEKCCKSEQMDNKG